MKKNKSSKKKDAKVTSKKQTKSAKAASDSDSATSSVESTAEVNQTSEPQEEVKTPDSASSAETTTEQSIIPAEPEEEATGTSEPNTTQEEPQEKVKLTPAPNPRPVQQPLEIDFSNSFVLTGNGNLIPRKAAPFHNGSKPVPLEFEEELPDLIMDNSHTLFGENTLFINERKEKHLDSLGIFTFDGILIDYRDIIKPRLYVEVVIPTSVDYFNLFFRITDFFAFLRHPQSAGILVDILTEAIDEHQELKEELQEKIGSKEIADFLGDMLKRKPDILLVMEHFWKDLPQFMETYTDTWGELVKPVVIKKYTSNKDILVTVQPDFSNLQQEKKKKAEKVVRNNEEDHFVGVSESVQDIYLTIKAAMLTEDSTLVFNPKQHYISMRRDRNIAFFEFRKKKLSIVIANPEKDTQENIKYHPVLTLADTAKRFWNGNEYCFTVMIENKEHLEEIINILKKLIAE